LSEKYREQADWIRETLDLIEERNYDQLFETVRKLEDKLSK
jgi:hypothetical protein